MREKINSLNELKEKGFIIMNERKVYKNNIKNILDSRGLNQADITAITGICKQNISEIVNNKMVPGVIVALQIAYALDVPVEDLYELENDAWVRIAKVNENTLFVDKYDMEIIDNHVRKDKLKTSDILYIDLKTKKGLTKKEYDNGVNKLRKEMFPNCKKLKWAQQQELQDNIDKFYAKRYEKLGKMIKSSNE